VLDEVHYLQDPYRGGVWEEVIIHLPLDVKIVSLSATVSNAEEFAEWIQTLRGTTAAVIEERRPVELRHHYLVEGRLFPMFLTRETEKIPNPEIRRAERRVAGQRARQRRGRRREDPRRRRRRFPRRSEIVEVLGSENMLPAIYFIFSRKGCDAAVRECMRSGLRLTGGAERRQIREIVESRSAYIDEEDLTALGYEELSASLEAGIASHHAGMIPVFKETVEELFRRGLVKVVFATETLSLGINVPARTVVIESLTKFTGEHHELMTPGEFTQLTGRAGRRGIDTLGHAVVLRQEDLSFEQIAGLASTRTYELVSSFRPSYNMATNLIRNYTREEADHLLNSSFAQFRADKDVVVLERLMERNEAYLASYKEKMTCEAGDFEEYLALYEEHRRIDKATERKRRAEVGETTRGILASVRPGTVLAPVNDGAIVVVGRAPSRRREPRLVALTEEDRVLRVGPSDFDGPATVVDDLADLMPVESRKGPNRLDPKTRKRLAEALAALEFSKVLRAPGADREAEEALGRLEEHPCHRCPDLERHLQWARRASRLEGENAQMAKRIQSKTGTLSKVFDRVLEVLESYGYTEGFSLTHKGDLLAHIYGENDLLISEAYTQGLLGIEDWCVLAGLVSTFVYESRGDAREGRMPTPESRKIYGRIQRLARRIASKEKALGLDLIRGTDAGFSDTVFSWCRGEDLEEVLADEIPAGDFIRSVKQTIDLLRQLQEATPDTADRGHFRETVDALDRGVVRYTGVLD
jgi:ATP-dependent RNA helicase HelY